MIPTFQDKAFDTISIPKGGILFKQGDRGDSAFIVSSGAVGLFREDNGQKILISTIREGEILGDMASVDGSPRTTTAFALIDTKLKVISAETLRAKIDPLDPFVRDLVQVLLHNVRAVTNGYTPKPRTLLDSVNTIAAQLDIFTVFLTGKCSEDLRFGLVTKLRSLEFIVRELRQLILKHRTEDRRSDSIPPAEAAQAVGNPPIKAP